MGVLIDPSKNLNYDMIKEYYANSIPSECEPFTFKIMMRERERVVSFSRDAINEYLGDPLSLGAHQLCSCGESLNQTFKVVEMIN